MPNMRTSELVQITVPEMTVNDLLPISDVEANQSKKLSLGNLSTFLVLNGILTGSFAGTASYAMTSATASYVALDSASYAVSSSWAANVITASHALVVGSSSYASTASYVATASFALLSFAQTVFSASFSNNAQSASYLSFNPNTVNGTASFAISASYVNFNQVSVSYASTAVLALNSYTASQALSCNNADTASVVQTASFLAFNGVPNGTASYAIYAGNVTNVRQDYGTFLAITQSIYSSQLDLVSVTPTFGGNKITNFEVYGTIDAPFSSSNSVNGRIEMFILDLKSGHSQSIDFSPVFINIGGSSPVSGTIRFPFVLRGEAPIYGLYKVYVTASYNEVYFDTDRPMKYKITSTSDQLSVASAPPIIFSSYPANAIMLYTCSLHPTTAFQGSASQVIFSGSSTVTSLLVPPNSVNILNYTWTLNGLVTMSVDNNPGLTYIGGIPTSCVSMSAANCGFTELPDMSTGSLGYLNVPGNTISTALQLPATMSYLNVANSYYVTFPPTLPYGMTVIIADGNGSLYTPYSIPNTLQTMSFNNCPNLTSWLAPALPTSLTYWSSNNTPLNNFPSAMPSALAYIDVTNNFLPSVTIGNIAAGLVSNGLSNGYISIYNNPGSASAFNITSNLSILASRGWTVVS